METLSPEEIPEHFSERSNKIIDAERKKQANSEAKHGKALWAQIVQTKVIEPSKRHAQNSFVIAGSEHMSNVDSVDGAKFRGEQSRQASMDALMRCDLITVSPRIDGRLSDVARPT